MVLIIALMILLSLSTVLLAWYFGVYPLLMGLITLIRDDPDYQFEGTPFISIIVPTYNEENVVRQRVKNLLELSYPDNRYEVLFVDSNSTDETVAVLRDELKGIETPEITVLEESERRGKASAINIGMQEAVGNIVLVSDANTWFDVDVLDYIAPHFEDPAVGAVAGSLVIPKAIEGLTSSNQFYRELEYVKGMGETQLDSVCQFTGEISAWRKHLATADTRSLSEDLDLSLQIRKQGYKIRYEPRAIAYEPEPSTARELITSNKRRLIGAIQATVKHRDFLVAPLDIYRALIFPSRKVLQLVSPFLFATSLTTVVALIVQSKYSFLRQYLLASIVGTVITGKALIAVKNRIVPSNEGLDPSRGMVIDIARYLSIVEYTILLAWKDFLIGNYSVLWQKSESDRQATHTDETGSREFNNQN